MSSRWVLLRGLTREQRHWGGFVRQLADGLPGARVTALDLPGNGRLNLQRSASDVPTMVAQARATLQRDGLAPPYRLLAMSLGAMVAIEWATRHPDEIAALVLINTSSGSTQPFHRRLRPGAWLPLLATLLPGVPPACRERTILRLTSQRSVRAEAAPLAWLACRRSHPVSRPNALRQLLAALRFTAPPAAPPMPVLVLCGASDRLVDPCCSRQLARDWKTSLAEHPAAGHDLVFDDAAWVLAQVQAWLTQRGASPPRHQIASDRSSPGHAAPPS